MNQDGQPRAYGDAAERAALDFLRQQGYAILARNFSTARGEVDIIAADGATVCFVEVRSRGSDELVTPQATVTPRKQRRVRAAASAYAALKHLGDRLCRFDVVSLVEDPAQKSGWDIALLRDAF